MTAGRLAAVVLVALGLAAAPAAAQSALEHPTNLADGWTVAPGTLHFNLLHRFTVSDPPQRKVGNAPTFLLGLGLPGRTMVGARYATNSELVAGIPNEWEFLARFAPLQERRGAPVQLAVQGGYNHAAESFDGELTVARRLGPVRVLGNWRGMSDAFAEGETRHAAGAGLVLELTRWLGLAGDVVSLLDRADDEDPAWSAGVQLAIPFTPHSLSLHASNVNANTVQGGSIGTGTVRYGFTFNVPFTPKRYFGSRGPASAPEPGVAAMGAMMDGDTVVVVMEQLAYGPARIEVGPGTTVVWRNRDPVVHTATSDDGLWSSDSIEPGGSWSYTFTEPGTFPYHCIPHPFMTGTVVVKEGS